MAFLADLHIHSRHSRATSPACNLEELHYWAQIKGIRVVGTGDFTHPAWSAELRTKLEPAAPGLFRLRPELAGPVDARVPPPCRAPVLFMLTGEISSIYKRDGRCRRIHSLVMVPDLATMVAYNARLAALGNIRSDGRPILGVDPCDLLAMLLELHPAAGLIPAHIWTPWFAMLGSQSGFDSPDACFGDLARHLVALETGLSSDPPMNWRLSALDRYALVSNSDLHSPANLGRNANIFHGEPDYFAMLDGLRQRDPARCGGTLDMFPEEGKYHHDGHRKCGVGLAPEASRALHDLCPVCGRPLVLGVLRRVVDLADRPAGFRPPTALPHAYIIPLAEILSELYDCGTGSKKVQAAYDRLVRRWGPELYILRELDPELLAREEPPLLAEALRRLRRGSVIRQAGYDGEYGVIRLFQPGEQDQLLKQGVWGSWLDNAAPKPPPRATRRRKMPAGPLYQMPDSGSAPAPQPELFDFMVDLSPAQRVAVTAPDDPVLIVAGPGAGKTRALTYRVAYLVMHRGVPPEHVLAITFTRRAAGELRERLARLLPESAAARVRVATFHAFCLGELRRQPGLFGMSDSTRLIGQDEELSLLRKVAGLDARAAAEAITALAHARHNQDPPGTIPGAAALRAALADQNLLPMDDVIPRYLALIRARPDVLAAAQVHSLAVDEYQDLNRAQYELIRRLAPDGRGLFAIGDPDQAIYGFRDADPRFFEQFTRDYPAARVVRLETNYRSSAIIITAANQVMEPGRGSFSVSGTSATAGPALAIRIHPAATAAAEADFIADEIGNWLGGTSLHGTDGSRAARAGQGGALGLRDIAVLARLRAQLPMLAEALERQGWPVQVIGDQPALEEAELRAVLDMVQAKNPAPNTSAADVLERAAGSRAAQALPPAARAALAECRRLARDFAGPWQEFADFLALRQGADRYEPRAERIPLMTIHAAKGLEFPLVFIAGCEAGLLPYAPPERPANTAEERRLFYVGMTRARQVLYLTWASRRALFGETRTTQRAPFMDPLAANLCEDMAARPGPRAAAGRQLEFKFE